MKRIIKVAFLIVFVLCVLLLLLSPFLVIGYEFLLAKWEIDNPYVNNNYKGWKTVEIDGFAEIQIPEDWSLVQEDGVITVFVDGEEWAKGTVLYTKESRFKDTDFIAWLRGVDTVDSIPDPMPGVLEMQASTILRFHTNLEDFETYYAIFLADRTKDGYEPNLILVTTYPLEPGSEMFDIAEAMMYSFAYLLADER